MLLSGPRHLNSGGRYFVAYFSLMLPSVLHNSCWLGDLSIRQLDPALGKFQTNLRNAETQIALDWALGTKLLSVSRCTICASSNGLNHLWQDFWVPFLQLYATCMTAIVIYLGVAKGCGCNFCTPALHQAWLKLKRLLNSSNCALYLTPFLFHSVGKTLICIT